MAGQRGHGGDHDLRQSRTDGNDGRTDEQFRQMEPPGQRRSTVDKPVTAFNKEQQTDDKQQYRDKHR